jgi:hypothetical protein
LQDSTRSFFGGVRVTRITYPDIGFSNATVTGICAFYFNLEGPSVMLYKKMLIMESMVSFNTAVSGPFF